MAITTGTLYDRVKREFGVQSDSMPFSDAFFSALLSVNNDMLTKAFIGFDVPTSTGEVIDLDTKYYNCVYYGVKYYLNSGAEWNIEQKGDLRAEYFMWLKRAQGIYLGDNAPDMYDIT